MTRSNKARCVILDSDHKDWRPWAYLHEDLLCLIANLVVGIVDFFAFGGACRSWRSVAMAQKENFMARQPPYQVIISVHAKRACSLHDMSNGKTYKTLLPDLTYKVFLGVSCGYLITIDTNNKKFWLVNLITRAELHFPAGTYLSYHPSDYRVILTYSTSLAGFVLVVVCRSDKWLQFCRFGDTQWYYYSYIDKPWRITDLAVFRGKLYVLTSYSSIGVLKLSTGPPVLTLLKVSAPSDIYKSTRQLVTSNDHLFMVDSYDARGAGILKLDFTTMDWVTLTGLEKETLFMSDLRCCSAMCDASKWGLPYNPIQILPNLRRIESRKAFRCNGGLPVHQEEVKVCKLERMLWYFPHQCYSKNLLDDDGA